MLCAGSLQLQRAGATPLCSAQASHCHGLSRYRARALGHLGFSRCGAQAQQLWPTGPAVPRHIGSSRTRARTRVPCIGRRILNHCVTREVPHILILIHAQETKHFLLRISLAAAHKLQYFLYHSVLSLLIFIISSMVHE